MNILHMITGSRWGPVGLKFKPFAKLKPFKRTQRQTMVFPNLQLIFSFLHLFPLIPISLSNPNLFLNLNNSVTDIHDLLPKYNIPIGLLPGNVKSYTLNSDDNSFTIELTHPCYVYFGDQLAHYDATITGKLDYGKVYDVQGIQAKKLFIWVSVTGMEVDDKSKMIEFHAGIFTQTMPLEDFQTIPICRKKKNLNNSVTDIHDLLPKYNIPIGLLPGNVKSYTLNSEDNSFTIELTHPCYVYFGDQLAHYDATITGKLDYGKVYDVQGIQAKKLFIWVSVTGMEVDDKSKMIEFHAGIFTQTMPLEDFQTIPICRKKGFRLKELASI